MQVVVVFFQKHSNGARADAGGGRILVHSVTARRPHTAARASRRLDSLHWQYIDTANDILVGSRACRTRAPRPSSHKTCRGCSCREVGSICVDEIVVHGMFACVLCVS